MGVTSSLRKAWSYTPSTSHVSSGVEGYHDIKDAVKGSLHGSATKMLSSLDSHFETRDTATPIMSSVKYIGRSAVTGAGAVIVMMVLLGGVLWLCWDGKQDNSWYSVLGKVFIIIITGGIVLSCWGRLLSGDVNSFQSAGDWFDTHVKSQVWGIGLPIPGVGHHHDYNQSDMANMYEQ
jgi:hypothetical protein